MRVANAFRNNRSLVCLNPYRITHKESDDSILIAHPFHWFHVIVAILQSIKVIDVNRSRYPELID